MDSGETMIFSHFQYCSSVNSQARERWHCLDGERMHANKEFVFEIITRSVFDGKLGLQTLQGAET